MARVATLTILDAQICTVSLSFTVIENTAFIESLVHIYIYATCILQFLFVN